MSTILYPPSNFHALEPFVQFLQFFGLARGESPDYQVISRTKGVEFRSYPALLLAETETPGHFEFARRENFRRLNNYLQGSNSASSRIEMTTPVLIEATDTGWKMAFYIPKKFTLSTLPRPQNGRIRVHLEPAQTKAVIRYSGLNSTERMSTEGSRLMHLLREIPEFMTLGRPLSAQYDSPYTIPFLRRNEVHLRVTSGN